jgi:IS5 family transposase
VGKLHQEIEPFYPKVKGAGRPPIGLARMLRMYVANNALACWTKALRTRPTTARRFVAFVGIDLNRESAPDATTLLKFRHMLEANGLTKKIFDTFACPIAFGKCF